jgi:hypothetical protein
MFKCICLFTSTVSPFLLMPTGSMPACQCPLHLPCLFMTPACLPNHSRTHTHLSTCMSLPTHNAYPQHNRNAYPQPNHNAYPRTTLAVRIANNIKQPANNLEHLINTYFARASSPRAGPWSCSACSRSWTARTTPARPSRWRRCPPRALRSTSRGSPGGARGSRPGARGRWRAGSRMARSTTRRMLGGRPRRSTPDAELMRGPPRRSTHHAELMRGRPRRSTPDLQS